MTSPTISPTNWHRIIAGTDGPCSICNAPPSIASRRHRAVDRREGKNALWIIRGSGGGQEIYDSTTERSPKTKIKVKRKCARHKYPKDSNRKQITKRVLHRIVNATRLLAHGLTWKQVAGKLNTSECVLLDNYTRHRELWDTSIEKATKDTAEILKSMAGTSELFANNGKLIRVAAAAAEQNDELLFVRVDGKQTLLDFVKDVYLPSRIDVTVEYTKILYSTVSRFNAFFGKAVSLDELNEPGLCSYLKALRRCVSARTVNNHRQRILTFWKAAYDQGIAERPPRLALVRRLPEEVDPPEAWTIDECSRIFSTASQWPGMVGDIPAGEWWLSLLLSIYWTSCRIGAIMSTPASAYKGGGILVRKQKNHRPQWYALPASCCKAINKTAPENRKFLWPWPQHPRTLWTVFRLIIQQAGVAQPPGGRQLFHRLRRTSLSLCAAVDPAIAQRQAGHADYSTTLKHYIDPKMARGRSAADVLPEPIITTSTERGVA